MSNWVSMCESDGGAEYGAECITTSSVRDSPRSEKENYGTNPIKVSSHTAKY